MWVSRRNNWHKDASPLERLLAERIIQRCDYNEVISNKHRTANGYTQLKELIHLCQLTQKRSRTVKTLIAVLTEASDERIPQCIVNDFIIVNYFQDLRKYILSIDTDKLHGDKNTVNLGELSKLSHHLKVY